MVLRAVHIDALSFRDAQGREGTALLAQPLRAEILPNGSVERVLAVAGTERVDLSHFCRGLPLGEALGALSDAMGLTAWARGDAEALPDGHRFHCSFLAQLAAATPAEA